ncbi:MAG: bifunctional DNA-formamidopyrimidine glycosylase/DNA-(apurinic or apyrimidinic site) lyase [Gammaproteobacteria bacterium]|nr:bifunctional DNA-formamidopyrimidine glycosylase/DNA-(apurinic or apyrimidinic site) lyase [Gammaproteobacteria bacterium]
MPELPEVETTRRGIAPYLLQQAIVGAVVRETRLRLSLAASEAGALSGYTVTAVARRAKYLLLALDQENYTPLTLLIHLGMSGSLRICEPDTVAGKHDHIDLQLGNHKLLRYHDPRRFGGMRLCHGNLSEVLQLPPLAQLGPEPLQEAFNADSLRAQCRGRQRSIKSLIMDQQQLVGVGNIYACEALFLAGIRPRRLAANLAKGEVQRLVTAIKTVLQRAIDAGGTTLRDFVGGDGQPGYFSQQLHVYGRTAMPCLTCQTTIKKYVSGGRSGFYCPKCQR